MPAPTRPRPARSVRAPGAATAPLSGAAVKAAALETGFDLCGLARAEPLDPGPLLRWLEAGYGADMAWMTRRAADRLDPLRVLAGARTVVAVACAYARPHAEASGSPVARYARGRDYHATMRDRLRALRRRLVAMAPGVDAYACVDTGAVMEKVWAERAGLGWIGKNGCLIHRRLGSWLVLAAIIVDRAVDAYDAPHPELCGECRFCLDACPTGAFPQPGVVDSRRCISYHSIENRGVVPVELRDGFRGRAFGCDVCQDVCPWNRAGAAAGERFAARPVAQRSLVELAALTREAFERLTRGTAVARARYDGLRRNALYALGAARDRAGLAIARRLLDDPSEVVRDAARWAVEAIEADRPAG